VDPFYRHVMSVHADLRPPLEALIDAMWQTRLCLVHADFSPKNVLVVDVSAENEHAAVARIALVDYETVHYGDPAFDLGFFLSHLMLKGVRADREFARYSQLAEAFWQSYGERLRERRAAFADRMADLDRRAVAHLAGCALARVDATSPVNYLPEPWQREIVRNAARMLLLEPVDRLATAFDAFAAAVRDTRRPA
jgi:5-methylthioribose kinase